MFVWLSYQKQQEKVNKVFLPNPTVRTQVRTYCTVYEDMVRIPYVDASLEQLQNMVPLMIRSSKIQIYLFCFVIADKNNNK